MQKESTLRDFSRIYFFNMAGLSIASTTFVMMLSIIKEFTPAQISLVVGITPLIGIPALIVWGKIIDRDKMLMKWSKRLNLMHGICILLLLIVDNFILFTIIATLKNIMLKPTISVAEEYITNLATTTGTTYGKIRVVGTVGFALIGVIAPLMILKVGLQGLILVGVVILVVTGVLFGQLKEIRVEDDPGANRKSDGIDWGLLRNKEFIYILLSSGVIMGAMQAAALYGTQIMLIEYQSPEALIGTLPILMTIFEVIVLFNVHRLNLEQKPYMLLGGAGVCLGLRWIGYAMAATYVPIILGTLIHGIVSGVGMAVQSQLLLREVKESERSSAFLICSIFQTALVPSVLNLLAGQMLDKYGMISIPGIYLVATCIGLVFVAIKVIKEKSQLGIEF